MEMFGCSCWNISMALIVRLWRSWEPHQANRISIFWLDGAAVAAPGAEVAAGGGAALGALHAAITRVMATSALCQANRE